MKANHGPLNRNHARAWLFALAIGGVSLSAQATFVSPPYPAGVTSGGSDFAGLLAKPTTLGGEMSGGYLRTPAGPTAGGTRLPMALKFAGNAGKFVGRALFLSPVGVGVGAAAWAAQECLEVKGGEWVLTCGPGSPEPSLGYTYDYVATPQGQQGRFMTPGAACTAWIGSNPTYAFHDAIGPQSLTCRVHEKANPSSVATWGDINRTVNPGCPVGWYVVDGVCSQNPPFPKVTQEQMEARLLSKPLPANINGVDWTGWGNPKIPVEQFILNPSPAATPLAQPLVIPQGNPVPVPNTNPQQYNQPVLRITPAPTAADPLRVDITPGTNTGTSSTGITGPQTPAPGAPAETPKEDPPVQCDKYPNSLGCTELDTPEVEIPRENKEITFAAEDRFGGGSCPANKSWSIQTTGTTVASAIDWQFICTNALPLRGMIMALAAFIALVIVLPGGGVRAGE